MDFNKKLRKEIESLQDFFFSLDNIHDFLIAYKSFYGIMAMKYYTHRDAHCAAQFKIINADKKSQEKINEAFDKIHQEVYSTLKKFMKDASEADTVPPHKSK